MPTFRYSAVTPEGTRVTGTVKGSTVGGVAGGLIEQGLQVRSVSKKRNSILQAEITPKKIKPVGLMNFSRQMAAFVRAGVPLLDAIAILRDEEADKTLQRVMGEISDSLRFGESFSSAVALHAGAFPGFFVSSLRSAEVTGELDVVLAQLSRYIEREVEARRKIKSALAYPALVMVMAGVTVVVLTVFVLPRFKTFFESFHAKLPLATRMLLAFTRFLGDWWYVIVGVMVGLLALFIASLRTRKGRELRDRALLWLPAIGPVVRFTIVERFSRILSSMVVAGVPMADSLQLAADGTNNLVYEKGLRRARDQMLEGEGIWRPIARTALFPQAMIQMIRVGEETGSLDEQLEAVASFYERELEYKIKALTNLFEPVAILAVGLIVGFVAIALVAAIYGIYNQVKL